MNERPGLTIEGVSKSYGDLLVLDDLSFNVRPGELLGFVGSNGAGKTTTDTRWISTSDATSAICRPSEVYTQK